MSKHIAHPDCVDQQQDEENITDGDRKDMEIHLLKETIAGLSIPYVLLEKHLYLSILLQLLLPSSSRMHGQSLKEKLQKVVELLNVLDMMFLEQGMLSKVLHC